ncbi:LuxR C-terminal-related transcriptional regulator [Streptomyces sp. NPDC055092]
MATEMSPHSGIQGQSNESEHHALAVARSVLSLASQVLQEPSLAAPEPLDLSAGHERLANAERAATAKLAQLRGESRGMVAIHQVEVMLMQIGIARALSRETERARQTATLQRVQQSLKRLRSASTVGELVTRAPEEISRLGFNRALFSRVQNAQWIAMSGYSRTDADLADAMVEAGSTAPRQLTRALVETDMVRHRTPLLIRDAAKNPRVHPELVEVTGAQTYVAAPLISRGNVVGLLHADENEETGTVDVFDREMLNLFSEGLGPIIERTVFYEQLSSLRQQLTSHASTVHDLINEFVESDVGSLLPTNTSSGTAPRPAPQSFLMTLPFQSDETPLGTLTRREMEVLCHLANGESNAEIAAQLFVSDGTVKSHVKHVLRKLGATNRADAVSRYHYFMQKHHS